MTRKTKPQLWILEIAAYEGRDTALIIEGAQEPGRLYAIIETGPKGAWLVDNAYRTRAEAKAACPAAR